MNILIVSSSANGDASVSNALVSRFVERVDPSARIVRRDVGANPLPHLTAATVAAIKGEPTTPAELEARALSDSLIAEMRDADLIGIRYTAAGPEGLMGDKKVVVIQSRAGAYGEGGTPHMDGQEPHIRILLGFMGITDVTSIKAEGLAFGPEAAQAAIDAAARELHAIADAALPLAA
jgi:FMN-dependent NADH-azoreductase